MFREIYVSIGVSIFFAPFERHPATKRLGTRGHKTRTSPGSESAPARGSIARRELVGLLVGERLGFGLLADALVTHHQVADSKRTYEAADHG